jgi:hypothetical protein
VWFRSVASGHYALSRGLLRGLVRTAADGEHPAPGGADAGCWERTCAWATLARARPWMCGCCNDDDEGGSFAAVWILQGRRGGKARLLRPVERATARRVLLIFISM